MPLFPAALDRVACPTFPGTVHFNFTAAAHVLRGLVEGEERCGGSTGVGGLIQVVMEKRAPWYSEPFAVSGRGTLQKLCRTAWPNAGAGCLDSLSVVAACGSLPMCVSARAFMASAIGADDVNAWGRPPMPRGRQAIAEPASARSIDALVQQRGSSDGLAIPSGVIASPAPPARHDAAPANPFGGRPCA